jgi:hypothetical protein
MGVWGDLSFVFCFFFERILTTMNIQELLKLDFKKLPDEILNAIYREAHTEVSKRRRYKLENNKELSKLINKKSKIKDRHRLAEFEGLLLQDWSEFYPSCNSDNIYYVYAHVDPNNNGFKLLNHEMQGIPFYIGKGCGDRAYDLKRNEGHGVKLRNLLNMGKTQSDIVYIFQDGLSESKAFEIEAKLIYFFGTQFNSSNGCLVNLTLPKTPFN